MIYIKQASATLHSLNPLYELHRCCHKADGYSQKLYWYILENRLYDKENRCDYLAYSNNQVVGSLQLYFFWDSVEIAVLVHPYFRDHFILRKMLTKAIQALRSKNIFHCVLICNIENSFLNSFLQTSGAILRKTVTEFKAPDHISVLHTDPKVYIQSAEPSDLDTLVEINHQCFTTGLHNQIYQRFINYFNERNRTAFIVKNTQDQVIGKLHVRIDKSNVVIHEVGILKQFQRQGYARSLMLNWLQQYSYQYDKPIIVEVLCDNIAGIALYRSCGFTKIESHNYYEVELIELENL